MTDKKLFIEKLYKYDLQQEVCTVAVPVAKGEMTEDMVSQLGVVDANGQSIISECKATSYWDDGTVRFVFVRFLPDLPANKNVEFYLKADTVLEHDGLKVTTDSGVITVDTGAISFAVSEDSNNIFNYVGAYDGSQIVGPVLKVGDKPKNMLVKSWEVTDCGRVSCTLQGTGLYDGIYRIHVRVTAFYGKDYIDVGFRLFNDTEEMLIPDSWILYIKQTIESDVDSSVSLTFSGNMDSTGCGDMNVAENDETRLHFRTTGTSGLGVIEEKISAAKAEAPRTLIGVSNYKTRFDISGTGETLSDFVDANYLIGEANEQFAEVNYGTFMADVTGKDYGVCATVFQAFQNFPKAIKATADGIAVFLIPSSEEKVRFASGMAREQRVQLHFHKSDVTIEELDNRSLIYQMPVYAAVDPAEYDKAKIFVDVVTPVEKCNFDVEVALIDKADCHGRAYGMMNWGDFPDFNYTAQGRGGGRLVWSNNEYDYPHAQFMMYARTGIRRFLDYGKVAAWHWMDVDVCHYSSNSLHIGGQWEHTACHNGGDCAVTGIDGVMVCSHEWVEGLLDLWHFTGDKRAYDTAIGIGENILKLLDTPMYQKAGEANARETGWALRSLLALYLETYDKKWIEKGQWIINQFIEWEKKYGAWLAPYTDNTVIRTGFMIAVAMGSVMRWYRVFPDETIRNMLIKTADDLIENATNGYGLFFYKDLPSLRRNGGNALLLEAMYIGYELTHDVKYLKAGMQTFAHHVDSTTSYEGGKQKTEDAVLVGKTSPKGFGQSFLPLVQFYNAAAREGLL